MQCSSAHPARHTHARTHARTHACTHTQRDGEVRTHTCTHIIITHTLLHYAMCGCAAGVELALLQLLQRSDSGDLPVEACRAELAQTLRWVWMLLPVSHCVVLASVLF